MQAIRDLSTKSADWSSTCSLKLQNKVRDFYAQLRHHRSIQSCLACQIATHFENEKNIKLYNQMSVQLSKEQRVISDIQWSNERYASSRRRHIAEFLYLFDSFSILQRKSHREMRSAWNQDQSAWLCQWHQHSDLQ